MGRINESESQYLMFHNPQPCSKVLSSPSEVVQWKTTALYFGIIEGIIFDIMIHLFVIRFAICGLTDKRRSLLVSAKVWFTL